MLLELYSWGVEVLTTIYWLLVCRVWNKLLVVTAKPGVKLVDVCVCVCVCVCVWARARAHANTDA